MKLGKNIHDMFERNLDKGAKYITDHSTLKKGVSRTKAVAQVAKALGYLKIADIAMKPIASLQEENWFRKCFTGTQAAIMNQTIGRIPGLGDIFRWINNHVADFAGSAFDFLGMKNMSSLAKGIKMGDPNDGFYESVGNKAIARKEERDLNSNNKKETNDAVFYSLLGEHKGFAIPSGYPKQYNPFQLHTGSVPVVVCHELVQNPNPDNQATTDRAQQQFTLLKAVRGLSATEYTMKDVAAYKLAAEALLYEYYNLKFCVRAAKTYSLVNREVGDNLILARGLDPEDLRKNMAAYERYLLTLKNYITNNVPVSGFWAPRLKYLTSCVLPDYQDAKVASLHVFSFAGFGFFDFSNDNDWEENSHMRNDQDSLFDIISNVDKVSTALKAPRIASLIADYFGAFGTACMWDDPDFSNYDKPLDMKDGTPLNLEQLKNAEYIDSYIFAKSLTSGGSATYKFTGAQAYTVRQANHGFVLGLTKLDYGTGNELLRPDWDQYLDAPMVVEVSYDGVLPQVSSTTVTMDIVSVPRSGASIVSDGAFQLSTGNARAAYDYFDGITPVTKAKATYTEEESLELLQFKALRIAQFGKFEAAAPYKIYHEVFATHEFAVTSSLTYGYDVKGDLTEYILMPFAFTKDGVAYSGTVDDIYTCLDSLGLWSQVDYMPRLMYTCVRTVNGNLTVDRAQVWDVDDLGTLDVLGLATSISYSTYSLVAATMQATGKVSNRAANIQSVLKHRDNNAKR